MLTVGAKGSVFTLVDEKNTACAMGSGDLPVYATPSMIALMESAACDCVRSELSPEETTVGTKMEIVHCAATPVGMKVRGESCLEIIDGRRLVFSVKAFDEAGLIGEGKHERFLVQRERFLEKTESKKRMIP